MTFPWEKPALPTWECGCRQPGLGGDCDGSCQHPPPGFRRWDDPPTDPLGIPAFLRRDANNRAPFMNVVATKPQPQACTEPPSMPWSADFNKPTE